MLAEDPRILLGAFVADTFGMDPIVVLAADRTTWRIRLAAAQARAKANNPQQDSSEG